MQYPKKKLIHVVERYPDFLNWENAQMDGFSVFGSYLKKLESSCEEILLQNSFKQKAQRTPVQAPLRGLQLLAVLKGQGWLQQFCDTVRIQISSASQFNAYAKRNPRCMIESYVSGKVVYSTLVTRKRHGEERWVPEVRGKLLFDAMMGNFLMEGAKIDTIEGAWMYGSNLERINALTHNTKQPVTIADVQKTWTGKRSLEWGFQQVNILRVVGEPGAYQEVVVRFTKKKY